MHIACASALWYNLFLQKFLCTEIKHAKKDYDGGVGERDLPDVTSSSVFTLIILPYLFKP